jgi:hypothetical protein
MNAEITSQLIETKRALRAAHVRVAHLSVFLDSLVCLFFHVNCVHFCLWCSGPNEGAASQ